MIVSLNLLVTRIIDFPPNYRNLTTFVLDGPTIKGFMIRVHLPPHGAAPLMDNDVGDPDNTSDHPKGTRPREPYEGA